MNEERQWLAVYTKPRWEKKVNRLLTDYGVHTYCPLNKVYRKWSDRVKKVEEPLLKAYVFVHVTEAERTQVRMTDGVLNFVYWQGRPAVVRPHEIEAIRQFLDEHQNVSVEQVENLQAGDAVMIKSGVMMGAEAVVERMHNRMAELVIETLGFKLRATLHPSKLVLQRRAPKE